MKKIILSVITIQSLLFSFSIDEKKENKLEIKIFDNSNKKMILNIYDKINIFKKDNYNIEEDLLHRYVIDKKNKEIYFIFRYDKLYFNELIKKIFNEKELIKVNYNKDNYLIEENNYNLITGGYIDIYEINIREFNMNKINIIKIKLKQEILDGDYLNFKKDPTKKLMNIYKFIKNEEIKLYGKGK
jgi:hypothetical protein